MKKLYSIIIFLMTLSSLDAEQVNPADAPEGKVHIYKKVGDSGREIEIFFPKNHAPATQTKLFKGIDTSIFLRLFSVAPIILICSLLFFLFCGTEISFFPER